MSTRSLRLGWIVALLCLPFGPSTAVFAAPASVGTWIELTTSTDGSIPDTKMERVFPPKENHPDWGWCGPTCVQRSWGAGAYDTKRDRLICFGGGAGSLNYGGNEVYAFDLASRTWERLNDPSVYDRTTWYTVDGTPSSRHSYDGVEYIPSIDRLLVTGGAKWHRRPDVNIWLFDFDTKTWESIAQTPRDFITVQAAYDPVLDRVVIAGHGELHVLDLATRAVAHASTPWLGEGTSDIDPAGRLMVSMVYTKNAPNRVGLTRLTDGMLGPPEYVTLTGDTDFLDIGSPGIAFDPVTRNFLIWAGDREVWSFDPRTLESVLLAIAEGPAPYTYPGDKSKFTRGVFGRWRYVPSQDVFIGVNGTWSNVWLFKPPR